MTLCGGILVTLWLLALTVTDLREHRLPNALTLPGAAVILTVAAVGAPLLTAGWGLLSRRRVLPHGPAMCAATAVVVALALPVD